MPIPGLSEFAQVWQMSYFIYLKPNHLQIECAKIQQPYFDGKPTLNPMFQNAPGAHFGQTQGPLTEGTEEKEDDISSPLHW